MGKRLGYRFFDYVFYPAGMAGQGKSVCHRKAGIKLAPAHKMGVLFIDHFFNRHVYANDRNPIPIFQVLTL